MFPAPLEKRRQTRRRDEGRLCVSEIGRAGPRVSLFSLLSSLSFSLYFLHRWKNAAPFRALILSRTPQYTSPVAPRARRPISPVLLLYCTFR